MPRKNFGVAASERRPAWQSWLGSLHAIGYTHGMKTAISIPDELFDQAERLARRSGKTRSGLYSSAVREYLTRHAPDEVTAAMDRVCDAVGDYRDPFTAAAARRTLEQSEW